MQEFIAQPYSDKRCVLGENPVWNPETETLTWVDIATGILHIDDSKNHKQVQTCQAMGAAIPTVNGFYIGCLTTGFYLINENGPIVNLGKPTTLNPRHRFNDAKSDSYGRIWAGEMRYCADEGNPGSLHVFYPDGTIKEILTQIGLPNGMDWSLDKKTFYFIDTFTRKVSAFDCDLEKVTISNRREIINITDGIPDGMTIDADGMLWVAQWGAGLVCRYNPYNGEILAKVHVDAPEVSSCCFGGKHLNRLFITTAGIEKITAGSGYTYVVEPGVHGVPMPLFDDNQIVKNLRRNYK